MNEVSDICQDRLDEPRVLYADKQHLAYTNVSSNAKQGHDQKVAAQVVMKAVVVCVYNTANNKHVDSQQQNKGTESDQKRNDVRAHNIAAPGVAVTKKHPGTYGALVTIETVNKFHELLLLFTILFA
jgi:hypothetical protein